MVRALEMYFLSKFPVFRTVLLTILNFFLNTTSAAYYTFWHVVFSFSLCSKYLLISHLTTSLPYELFGSVFLSEWLFGDFSRYLSLIDVWFNSTGARKYTLYDLNHFTFIETHNSVVLFIFPLPLHYFIIYFTFTHVRYLHSKLSLFLL